MHQADSQHARKHPLPRGAYAKSTSSVMPTCLGGLPGVEQSGRVGVVPWGVSALDRALGGSWVSFANVLGPVQLCVLLPS